MAALVTPLVNFDAVENTPCIEFESNAFVPLATPSPKALGLDTSPFAGSGKNEYTPVPNDETRPTGSPIKSTLPNSTRT